MPDKIAIDKPFSYCIRERDNRVCKACGVRREYPDCAHIKRREHMSTRWHPQNAICLCRSCHRYFTVNPDAWDEFCEKLFGDGYMSEIQQMSHQPLRLYKKGRREMYEHWRAEMFRIQALRRDGHHGPIELKFPPYLTPISEAGH